MSARGDPERERDDRELKLPERDRDDADAERDRRRGDGDRRGFLRGERERDLLRGGDLPRLGGDHLLGEGVLRRLRGDHRPLLYEETRRGERERDLLRLSRLRDRDLEYDRERDREAEDLDRLRLRPFLSPDRVLSLLSLERERERDRERDPERDRERELEFPLLTSLFSAASFLAFSALSISFCSFPASCAAISLAFRNSSVMSPVAGAEPFSLPTLSSVAVLSGSVCC